MGDGIKVLDLKRAVFIHGAGGGGWEWRFWLPEFQASDWACIAKDLDPVESGLVATGFEDYLRQVVRWTGDAPSVLIGASMGGILALKAAEKLEPIAIVLVNGVPPAPEAALDLGPDFSKRHYPEIVEWSKGTIEDTVAALPDADGITTQFAFRNWRDESGAVLNAISKGISVESPTCPVLIVLGEDDTDIPPAAGRALAKRYEADLLSYPGMSHVGPLLGTRASEVAKDVLSWLDANIR